MPRSTASLWILLKLWLGIIGAWAMCSSTPAIAQSDPQWGILTEIVERDFEANKYPLTVRWIAPGQSIRFTMWAVFGKTSFDIAIDEQSGQLMEGKKLVTIAPNGELLRDGERMLWRDGTDHYVFRPSGYKMTISPLRAGNLSGMRDRAVASGKVTPANPGRTPTSIESAQVTAPAIAAPSIEKATVVSNVAQTFTPIVSSGARLALVIGNSAYAASMGQLPNPANDAVAMARALGALGFQVTLVRNADQKMMKRAISDFGKRLGRAGPGSTGLFFYAGHGIQAKGINYLIPTDANIQTQADVDMEAVGADTVLEQMEEAGASTNIVILDACRNMPMVRGFRSASRGLAPMDAPNGSFIAYSTAPGSVAADGLGANSPFVTALVKNLGRKGESIESIFRDVRREVLTTTEGTQTPWDSSSLIQPFYFAGR